MQTDNADPAFSLANKNYVEPQDRMALLPNYYAWIVGHFLPDVTGTVVDLGAGAGHQIAHYLPSADKVIAVDFNKDLFDRTGVLSATGKLSWVELDLRGAWAPLAQMQASTVIALDVLEHFEDDAEFVSKVSQILRVGGKFIVKVPADPGLYSDVDRASGHFRRYGHAQIKALIEAGGFRTVRLNYMNPLGALAYRLKRRKSTNFSRTFSLESLKLINWVLPYLRPLDRLQFLGGLSLIGAFERGR